ncbi:MAG: hypothetical protein ACYC2H_05200 [Thermoplasmatota archaeon]
MDRRLAWTLALAPFATLAGVIRQVPSTPGLEPMPWWQALAHTVVLLALMAAHAKCYALWTPHAPNRMLVNEFLTRAWFVIFGLLVVLGRGDTGPIYLVMAAAWGVAAWCTHYLVLRSQKGYRALENLAQLGLFLVGLALMALMAIRIA